MGFSVRASLEQFSLPHPSGAGQLTISVAAPAVVPEAGAPVLYVVDGDVLFGIAAELSRTLTSVAGFPPYYVVGIGYDADYADFLKLRTADLTPSLSDEAAAGMGKVGAVIGADRNGAAGVFLDFLVDTLRPQIAERYPGTAAATQILFGHSLGGLFATDALLTRPDAFSAFIISSPSLWWDGFSMLRKLPVFPQLLAGQSRQPRVFIDVGGKEQDPPTNVPEGMGVTIEEARAQIMSARMVDAAREFAEALKHSGVADLKHMVFADEDHVSVAPAALIHGMRFALGEQD